MKKRTKKRLSDKHGLSARASDSAAKSFLLLFFKKEALAVFLVALCAAPSLAQTLRIGTEPDYAPFEFKDASGTLQGFEIELGQAICRRAALDCQYVSMDFDGLIPALDAHKIDAALSQISVTPARRAAILFTDPLTTVQAQFIAAKDAAITADPASLQGKTIGVQSGTTHETYANTRLKSSVTIKVYETQDEMFQDLEAGRIDASLQDRTVGYDWLAKAGTKDGYAFAGQPINDPAIFGAGTAIGLRQTDTALAGKLDTAIKAVRADGTFAKINAKYFPFSIAP